MVRSKDFVLQGGGYFGMQSTQVGASSNPSVINGGRFK